MKTIVTLEIDLEKPVPNIANLIAIRASMMEAVASAEVVEAPPIDMVLFCPQCGTQHIDQPSNGWLNPPHRSHLCEHCEFVWRPADVATNGVIAVNTKGDDDSTEIKDHPLLERFANQLDIAPQPQLGHQITKNIAILKRRASCLTALEEALFPQMTWVFDADPKTYLELFKKLKQTVTVTAKFDPEQLKQLEDLIKAQGPGHLELLETDNDEYNRGVTAAGMSVDKIATDYFNMHAALESGTNHTLVLKEPERIKHFKTLCAVRDLIFGHIKP